MRVRTVKRYHCDHCKKATLQCPAMERHEAHCTANPNRVCKMCRMDPEAKHRKPSEIAALIDSFGIICLSECPTDVEMEIRDFVDNCPACLLAGSRQSQHGLPFKFEWKDERESWLSIHQSNERPGFGG
jgi:hypothetical protein